MGMNEERELGWDDSIEKDGKEFITLPAGDYDFEIESFERARSNGSEKMPPCNMAVLQFTIKNPHGEDISVKENFLLHTKLEWKLSELFTSVGMKQKGERVRMNWSALPGSTGRCKLKVEHYTRTGKTGPLTGSNDCIQRKSKSSSPGSFKEAGRKWSLDLISNRPGKASCKNGIRGS